MRELAQCLHAFFPAMSALLDAAKRQLDAATRTVAVHEDLATSHFLRHPHLPRTEIYRSVDEVYRRFFPKDYPARIFINVPAWNGGFDIEVDCIAAV